MEQERGREGTEREREGGEGAEAGEHAVSHFIDTFSRVAGRNGLDAGRGRRRRRQLRK